MLTIAYTYLFRRHVMVLLALDDVAACKFLRKRMDAALMAMPVFRVYVALHKGVSFPIWSF